MEEVTLAGSLVVGMVRPCAATTVAVAAAAAASFRFRLAVAASRSACRTLANVLS